MQDPKETLQYLLSGKDPISQKYLDDYFKGLPAEPKILWYPSAGDDFRDILELSADRAINHGVSIPPDIFIHSDCDSPGYKKNGEFDYDEGNRIRINEIYELNLNPEANIRYFVDPKFYSYPQYTPAEPVIQLIDITWISGKEGNYSGMVLYFTFENNNFLEEVILKFRIGISHLLKVREGLSDTGCRMSITYVLDILSELKTKYLIFGDGFGSDSIYCQEYLELEKRLYEVYKLNPCSYTLKQTGEIPRWSGHRTGFYKINYQEKLMKPGDFVGFWKQLT